MKVRRYDDIYSYTSRVQCVPSWYIAKGAGVSAMLLRTSRGLLTVRRQQGGDPLALRPSQSEGAVRTFASVYSDLQSGCQRWRGV